MTPEQLVEKGICPECEALDLHAGPRGGTSANFACFSCHARFNAAFVYGVGVSFLERTGDITDSDKDDLFRPGLLQHDGYYLYPVRRLQPRRPVERPRWRLSRWLVLLVVAMILVLAPVVGLQIDSSQTWTIILASFSCAVLSIHWTLKLLR